MNIIYILIYKCISNYMELDMLCIFQVAFTLYVCRLDIS